jgi:hypothetical protein
VKLKVSSVWCRGNIWPNALTTVKRRWWSQPHKKMKCVSKDKIRCPFWVVWGAALLSHRGFSPITRSPAGYHRLELAASFTKPRIRNTHTHKKKQFTRNVIYAALEPNSASLTHRSTHSLTDRLNDCFHHWLIPQIKFLFPFKTTCPTKSST